MIIAHIAYLRLIHTSRYLNVSWDGNSQNHPFMQYNLIPIRGIRLLTKCLWLCQIQFQYSSKYVARAYSLSILWFIVLDLQAQIHYVCYCYVSQPPFIPIVWIKLRMKYVLLQVCFRFRLNACCLSRNAALFSVSFLILECQWVQPLKWS